MYFGRSLVVSLVLCIIFFVLLRPSSEAPDAGVAGDQVESAAPVPAPVDSAAGLADSLRDLDSAP